jgi:Ca2+-binding RTX toxin-like protein
MAERSRRLTALTGACLACAGFAADEAGAAFSARVDAGTLRVAGDGASDRLALRSGGSGVLLLDVGADGSAEFRFDRETFAAIDVDAGGGDDAVLVDESAGAFADEALTLSGGSGNDVLSGGSGSDVLDGGDGDDAIDGNGGDDDAALGTGNDRVVWDAADGSDRVDDAAGDDVLTVNGTDAGDRFLATPTAKGLQVLRGISAVTTFEAAAVERVVLTVRGGVDIVTVADLSGSGVHSADVDLAGADNAPDFVTFNGTQRADAVTLSSAGKGVLTFSGLPWQARVLDADENRDNVAFLAGGGDDAIAGGVGVGGPERVNIDGGEGTDTVTYRGTKSGEAIAVDVNGGRVRATALATTSQEAAVERFVVEGLDGADTLSAGEGLAGLTALTLDGGAGDDRIAGGDGGDAVLGGPGSDVVDGNGGDDSIALGSGDDRVVWDAGDGSDQAAGELGDDVVAVNGGPAADKVDLSAGGPGARIVRGEEAVRIETVERAAIAAFSGTDVIAVNDLGGTGVRTVDADLGGADGAVDTVIQRGTERVDSIAVTRSPASVLSTGLAAQLRITGSEAANDQLRILTLGGEDQIAVAADVRTAIATSVDE